MLPQDTIQSTVLTIDLGAIRKNINMLKQKAPHSACAGVVKADAYGLGIKAVLPAFLSCGIDIFFVATPEEGVTLRTLLGPGPVIYILAGLYPGAARTYQAHDLRPVLNSLEQIQDCPPDLTSALHIDTGMRRLGLDTHETQKLMEDPDLYCRLSIALVMSHFACADEPDHPLTREQYQKFCAVAALFPTAQKSLSNSAGVFAAADYHFDLIRPGMAVYGLNPSTGPNPMMPVVSLKARVLQIREVLRGESVGYGACWTAPGPTRVATIALGYADGILRSLSGRGVVYSRGRALPLLGRVSMDLITVDAGAAPEMRAGDWVDVLGPQHDVDALAREAGTIGYEILTQLGRRHVRHYVNS
jgi:alanine racemase